MHFVFSQKSKENEAGLANPTYTANDGDRESIYDEINDDRMRRTHSLKAKDPGYSSLNPDNMIDNPYQHMNGGTTHPEPGYATLSAENRDHSSGTNQYQQMNGSATATAPALPRRDNTYSGLGQNNGEQSNGVESPYTGLNGQAPTEIVNDYTELQNNPDMQFANPNYTTPNPYLEMVASET